MRLLPTLDVYGFYGANVVGGPLNSNCNFEGTPCYPLALPAPRAPCPAGYGGVLSDLVNSRRPTRAWASI